MLVHETMVLCGIDAHLIKSLRLYINNDLSDFNINLASFDNFNIPLNDNSLDYITSLCGLSDIGSEKSSNDFNRLTANKEQAINEVYRILKPGGCFITIERTDEWEFDISKTYIEEIQMLLNEPSWHDKFVSAGFEIETEEKYLQKASTDEIRTLINSLIDSHNISQFGHEKDNKDVDKIAKDFNIELDRGYVLYALRKLK